VKQLLECHYSTNPLQLSHNAVKTRVFEKETSPWMSTSSSDPRDCYLAGLAQSPALSSEAHRAQYVIPYGIGGNPFGVDVFGSAMQLMPVLQTPTTARCLRACGRDRVPLRSRATLRAGIRTSNDCAHSPKWSRDPSVDKTQVRSISSSWTIVPHRWAEWRSIYPAARSNLGASIA
jgi:hypothetical protein